MDKPKHDKKDSPTHGLGGILRHGLEITGVTELGIDVQKVFFGTDSRAAARRIYRRLKPSWLFNTTSFTGNVTIALLITYFFRQLGYGDPVDYVFFLTVLAVGLWISEAIPPFAVGIFLIAMLLFGFGTDYILTHQAPVEMYLGTWTSNVIWLLLGGFFLAAGMREAELDRSLFRFAVARFGQRPDRLLLGIMLLTALGSMIMSNTAITGMMLGSVLPLIRVLGKESAYAKALLIGIPAAASVGGIGTIIGSTPNAIAVGALREIGIYISFVEWMAIGMPLGLLMVWLFWKYLNRKAPFKELEVDMSKLLIRTQNTYPTKRRAVIFTLIVTIGLWLTEPLHGIPVAATSAVPIVLLTLTQVLTSEHVRSLPWDTLMLVAGGLALGIALVDVGLTDIAMVYLRQLPIATIFLLLILSYMAIMFSNVMSNTAASSILVPLGLSLTGLFGMAAPVIIAISCSCALLLPVSTPSNAIAFSTGMLEQKDFRRGGIFFILIAPALAFGAGLFWAWIRYSPL
jgi:sodium-dependent dicarboxylate transporter 2/3/5